MPNHSTKTIVITGVSRGLGRGLCDQLIALGHTVIGIARSADAIRSLQARYPAANEFSQVDVTDPVQVDTWAKRTLAGGRSPDLLINNAGAMNTNALLWQIPAEEFSRVIRVNLTGTFHCIRAFVPSMIAAGRGGIINMSSGWGTTTSPLVAPYCASKWGVEGLSQALAQELPGQLFCVALNPGVIDTDMLRSCFGASAEQYPSVREWSQRAAPYLLTLSRRENGMSLSVAEAP